MLLLLLLMRVVMFLARFLFFLHQALTLSSLSLSKQPSLPSTVPATVHGSEHIQLKAGIWLQGS